jgi:hypothetical protein
VFVNVVIACGAVGAVFPSEANADTIVLDMGAVGAKLPIAARTGVSVSIQHTAITAIG